LSTIGSQIGQFIKRKNAEAGLRASEERWRAVFETPQSALRRSILSTENIRQRTRLSSG
jgi:hypothetical protein